VFEALKARKYPTSGIDSRFLRDMAGTHKEKTYKASGGSIRENWRRTCGRSIHHFARVEGIENEESNQRQLRESQKEKVWPRGGG